MNRNYISIALSSAIGLAVAAQSYTVSAQVANPDVVKRNEERAKNEHLVKCYGINLAGRNDCAGVRGAHACAGQATIANDPDSFILVPEGACQQISGGALKPQHQ